MSQNKMFKGIVGYIVTRINI